MKKIMLFCFLLMGILILHPHSANAFSDPYEAALSASHVVDDAQISFQNALGGSNGKYATAFVNFGTDLFWGLIVISIFYRGWEHLKNGSADIFEFTMDFVRYVVTIGFFYFLLKNGIQIADSILNSFLKLGGQTAGMTPEGTFKPSHIINQGLTVLKSVLGHACDQIAVTSPSTWLMALLCLVVGVVFLILTAYIGINIMLQMVQAWILFYCGIIVLGFSSVLWGQEMVLNYFKTVIGCGIRILTLIVIVGIGSDIISQDIAGLNPTEPMSLIKVLLIGLTIFLLSEKLPDTVGNLIGASFNSATIGHGGGVIMNAAAGVAGGAAFAASPLSKVASDKFGDAADKYTHSIAGKKPDAAQQSLDHLSDIKSHLMSGGGNSGSIAGSPPPAAPPSPPPTNGGSGTTP